MSQGDSIVIVSAGKEHRAPTMTCVGEVNMRD